MMGPTPFTQGTGTGRTYAFAYRSDGLLKKVTSGTTAYTFTYGMMDGLLATRNAPGVTHQIDERDEVGRATSALVTVSGTTVLTEAMPHQLDGRLSSYAATRAGLSTLAKDYSYNGRGQLFNEESDDSVAPWSNQAYRFDREVTSVGGGLGVRTLLQRTLETSDTGDLEPGSWQALNAASPATNPLDVFGRPLKEGPIVGSTNTYEERVSAYDAAGNQTQRGLAGGITQTLTWDAFGRLLKVSQRNGSNNGFDFSAVYDGLGRRVQTSQQTVSGGSASGSHKVIDSFYDPSVRFLELGVAVDGSRAWKVYGPDLSGGYGGLHGMGGLLATVEESGGARTSLINDQFGNVLARVSGGTVIWSTVELGAYGLGPNSTAPDLNAISDLASVTNWRGLRRDPTLMRYMGERHLGEPDGKWTSYDPEWNTGDMSGYSFAANDPVNFVDPDGRFGKSAISGWNGTTNSSISSTRLNNFGSALGGTFSGGVTGGQNGAGGVANFLSFNSIHGAFGSDSGSSEYSLGRNITYGTAVTVAVVGTGGFALKAAGGAAGLYVGATNLASNSTLHAIAGTSLAGAGVRGLLPNAANRGSVLAPTLLQSSAAKAVNLPAFNKLTVNMTHIVERHVEGGPFTAGRTVFKGMNERGAAAAIKQAYNSSTTIAVQGDRVLLSGTSKTGVKVEMWLNKAIKVIETAYPVNP